MRPARGALDALTGGECVVRRVSAALEPSTGGGWLNTKAVVALLILFGSLPFAAASNQVQTEGGDVEGRAILFDLTKFDPDLAAVAGLAQAKVQWFGGAISFDRGREGWVYATTAGTDDPTDKRLIPTGQWYNFTDDNDATWLVQEWYYLDVREVQYRLGDQTATEREGHKVYVWTVKTTEEAHRDGELRLDYNFVVVVDVTKLGMFPVDENGQRTGAAYGADGGEPTNDIDLHFTRTSPKDRCVTC